MKTKEYTTIDRNALDWPSGEWDGEPDKKQWQDEQTGLPCLAVRHPTSGHWCGYVGVEQSHPYHGKGYDDVPVETHGGLTFADKCQPHEDESTGVCHLPEKDEPDNVWWFGFDCHHSGDYSPRDLIEGNPFYDLLHQNSTYKKLEYIEYECKSLAEQLIKCSILESNHD